MTDTDWIDRSFLTNDKSKQISTTPKVILETIFSEFLARNSFL